MILSMLLIRFIKSLGISKGSQFIIDPEKIGYETCAYMGLYLKEPEKFDQVVEQNRVKGLVIKNGIKIINN